jgi:hypothetical protein
MNVYQSDEEQWLEIYTKDTEKQKAQDLFPANMVTQQRIYLKIDKKFFDEKFKNLEKLLMIDEDKRISKIRKFLKDCPFVDESVAM